MQSVLRIFRWLMIAVIALFFHYVLPQHDVVQVTSTEIIRADFSSWNRMFYAQADSGNAEVANRDLRLISTSKKESWLLGFLPRESTQIMVYRNEDTGWIWPPYFKFDSSDLQAEASALDRDQWAVVTHYGWRVRWASIYPNAIGIRPVEGPNVYPIPWFSIIMFVVLAFGFGLVRAMWRQFRERSVDPLLDAAGDEIDEVRAGVAERRSGINSWLNTWRKKDHRR